MDDDIVYEKKPPSKVSWKRRTNQFTLTAADTHLRNLLVKTIQKSVAQKNRILRYAVMSSIMCEESSSTSSDDHNEDGSSTSSHGVSSEDEEQGHDEQEEDTEDEDDFLFTIAVCFNMSFKAVRSLMNKYWDEYGVKRRDFHDLPPNPPVTNRHIDDWNDADIKAWSRFEKSELHVLYEHFMDDINGDHVIVNNHKVKCEFALLIGLIYLAGGSNYTELHKCFGGDTTLYSHAINWFFDHLYSKYYHKICGDSFKMYTGQTHVYRDDIHKTAFAHLCDFDVFRIFGFIDCKGYKSVRPGGSGVGNDNNERQMLFELQRAFYSRYGKSHGLRLQAITLPDGMFGHIYISPMSQNDKGVLNLSGLQEALMEEFDRTGTRVQDMHYPCLAGDDIYVNTLVVTKSNSDDVPFHRAYKSARVRIEHHFGLVMNLWKLLMMYRKNKIAEKDKFMKRIVVAHFLTNCFTCFRGNTVATSFQTTAPSIDDYLRGPHVYYNNEL